MSENMKQKVVTKEGLRQMEEHLQYLKTTRTVEVADQIAIARGYGDLSENAEYEEAKKEQARLLTEIADLEDTLRICVVFDENTVSSDRVNIGSKVKVLYLDDDLEDDYEIVGANEANDIDSNKISNESPVGAALINRKVGDTIDVQIPNGLIRLKIISIA